MAKKKYKNMKIEQEELKPIAVGAFESRKKTSIGTVIILTFFILVVVFLPQISDIVNEYLNLNDSGTITETPSEDPTDDPDEEEPYENVDETFYLYTANLSIERETITVNDIVVDSETNTISFTINNNTSSSVNLKGLNYYFEIYNADRTLIERVKVITNDSMVLSAGEFRSYTKNISSEAASEVGYLVFVSKAVSDYPEITLGANSTLVCVNDHETVTYEFSDDLLKALTSVMEYTSTDDDYTELYTSYQNLASNYNSLSGVTSVFVGSSIGFNVTTIVDLEEASQSYIFNADTFGLDTEAKVVSFEMEAQGFDCD